MFVPKNGEVVDATTERFIYQVSSVNAGLFSICEILMSGSAA